jgi:hypothetical protein
MKLPLIPQDKANHFVYGFAIYFIANLFLNLYYSFGIVFIIALSKELYDQYKYKGFDIKDLFATMIFPTIEILKFILNK